MRKRKRHNPYGRIGVSWGRLSLLAAMCWLVANWYDHHAPSSLSSGLSAHENPRAAGKQISAYCCEVWLPRTDTVEKAATSRVERALKQLLPEGKVAGARRPVVVFEFHPGKDSAGEGSSFGDAVDLARFISGDRLSGVETVAWLPKTVKGHAVLPVLACEKIIMGRDAEIGAAGINERTPIEDAIRTAYTEDRNGVG